MYSFGILLWQVFTARTPFEGINREIFMKDVVEGGVRPDINELDDAVFGVNPSEFLRTVNDDLKDIISKCWDQDFEVRPNMKDINEVLNKMYYDYTHGAGDPDGCCTVT